MGELEAESLIWSGAIAVAGAGILMRAWATCHCRYGHAEAQPTVARTGPYAYIRNPLYVGNILIAAGATIASELLWLVPITLVWTFAIYAIVAKVEEARMLDKFGSEYARYRDEVPAWLPSRRRSSDARKPSPFVPALAWQSVRLVWLLPFVAKELGMFGLG